VIRVLVLTAIHVEARGLARRLGLPPVAGASWPWFRGGVLELGCVGLRASELERRRSAFRPADVVIAAGTCGALSPELREGTLIVPDVVIGPGGDRYTTDALPGLRRTGGSLVTLTAVAETGEAKARLWMETGAFAVDMESAAIVAWAKHEGRRAAAVRAVSDTARSGVPRDVAGIVGDDGEVSTVRAVRVVVNRPRALRDAMALRRGTEAALDAIATALASVARHA
jgi:adenosylhomocysteine nucleosidase